MLLLLLLLWLLLLLMMLLSLWVLLQGFCEEEDGFQQFLLCGY